MKYLITFLISLALLGCIESPASKAAKESEVAALKLSDAKAAQTPEQMFMLPDGRVLYRIKITARQAESECNSCRLPSAPHWVYIAGSDLTINKSVTSGKSTVNEVQVLIDGKPMTLEAAKAELEKRVIAYKEELAELKRLQDKRNLATKENL